ncbi:hypothetical protein PGQ11_000434 [Apiospora arundinis]
MNPKRLNTFYILQSPEPCQCQSIGDAPNALSEYKPEKLYTSSSAVYSSIRAPSPNPTTVDITKRDRSYTCISSHHHHRLAFTTSLPAALRARRLKGYCEAETHNWGSTRCNYTMRPED